MDQNLTNKLGNFLNAMDSQSLSKQDFLKAFEQVVNFVIQHKDAMGSAVGKMEQTYQAMIGKMQNDHSTTLADMKARIDKLEGK